MSTHQRQANNYSFCFRSCPTKVIPVRGWRFAPACCAAQSVLRRGPSCAVPLHRLVWAALNLHCHCELHQPSASAGLMQTVCASLSFGVRRPKWCGLTGRSTGHFAAGRVWARLLKPKPGPPQSVRLSDGLGLTTLDA